ncbi:2-succinyl-5-enolpyruvyl-6-hydroxy-3-cyclohexene-1-carboxylic-acid synthase [Prevotella corporis]|uniref:2-succinyl-5-enolpyruvyl-6-hydroxy-3- cyclohexene-1-carboxylic-acid synthase n=1 Tax=Prevotella corporis TaxID=28128 RepID=UPI0023F53941|nr:2-succinyl-5-enolpyruvyl-6-hydroxy-3-cyclohexene-1-carboxylic-acid synthase [Prevotella corporis]
MFSNKENVNILTALLVKSGIRKAVVCPGSRNSPIVHNLCECKQIECYSVTDERSAGFFALGVCLSEYEPVVVCVTSGTALLNVAPAVAEAYYQHLPLIIVSADRPQQWIDQSDGQTIHQANVLEPHVCKSVDLPEPSGEEQRWYCNRLVNEALLATAQRGGGPVHINVPITEPLFEYNVETLPPQRLIRRSATAGDIEGVYNLVSDFKKARKPMIVVGQMQADEIGNVIESLEDLCKYTIVLQEKLANDDLCPPQHFDELLSVLADDDRLRPDFLIYIGGTIVSKRLKRFLRGCKGIRSVLVDQRGDVRDTFMNLTDIIECTSEQFFSVMADELKDSQPTVFGNRWKVELEKTAAEAAAFQPDYSQMLAVKRFHELYDEEQIDGEMVYGNSSAVRLGNIYSNQYIHVNRGVNGIEGTLSVAVGMAVARREIEDIYCVIGDLSFFYDQNALWNRNLDSNLGILLLNNGGGGLFHQLAGLEESPHRDSMIGASHETTAEGICEENDIVYFAAHDESELETGLKAFFDSEEGPVLLEVFTDSEEDARVMREYYEHFKKSKGS